MKKFFTLIFLSCFLISFNTLMLSSVAAAQKYNKGDYDKNCQTPSDPKSPECKTYEEELKKDKIDLIAPFSKKGDNLFCRYPYTDYECKTEAGPGDGCYEYISYENKECKKADGSIGQVVQRIETQGTTEEILEAYVGMVFTYALGLGIGFSVLMVVIGGIQVITAGTEDQAISKGKDRIIKGIVGIGLLILSAVILNTINPLFFKLDNKTPVVQTGETLDLDIKNKRLKTKTQSSKDK
jgi:hypothetical protein